MEKNKIKEKIQEYKLDIILILILLIFFISTNIITYSKMQQLPSPIYGGDLYYQMGCINHIKYGGNTFDNCNLISQNPGYFPLYSFFVASFSNLFNLETMKAEFLFSNIILFLGILISYILFKKLLKNSYVATIGVLLFIKSASPILKYTDFAMILMAPLFILALYLFYEKQTYPNAILLAIITGLGNLSHSVFLPVTYFILAVFTLILLNNKDITKINLKDLKTNLISLLPYLCIIFGISFLISLLYWFEPLFISKAQTSLHYLDWNGPGDMSKTGLQFKILFNIIKITFLSFSNFTRILMSLFALLGIFYLITIKNLKNKFKFTIISTISLILITFSYFLTIPILGIHFVPDYIFFVFGTVIITLYVLTNLEITLALIKQKLPQSSKIITFSLILIIFLLTISFIGTAHQYRQNKWYQASLNPIPEYQISMQNYILKNTDVNDIILTTKETGFMLNALTGRKLVNGRRAQNDPFEDMDRREMESAVILYGNNTETKKELIKKYSIKYLYWDYYWINTEYHFDQEGKISGWFDPLISINQTYINLLKQNNVSYKIQNTYVDPALKSQYHPTFDLIFITPNNYRNAITPWKEDLDKYLEEVWSYEQEGQKIAVLYKIVI